MMAVTEHEVATRPAEKAGAVASRATESKSVERELHFAGRMHHLARCLFTVHSTLSVRLTCTPLSGLYLMLLILFHVGRGILPDVGRVRCQACVGCDTTREVSSLSKLKAWGVFVSLVICGHLG